MLHFSYAFHLINLLGYVSFRGGQILRTSHSGTVNIFSSISHKNYANIGSVDVTYVLIHSSSGKMTIVIFEIQAFSH